jgi:hypothetical protein
MSKAQKGNKENKKPKAEKNQSKGQYVGLQGGARPRQAGQQPVREEDLTLDSV